MIKKKKNKNGEVVLSGEEYKFFKEMANNFDQITVIRVGDNKETSEERLERYKESNKDLRRKVAFSIREKVELQGVVAKLKVIVKKDENEIFESFMKMEKEIKILKSQNIDYSDTSFENSDLKSKIRVLNKDIANFKKEINSKNVQMGESRTKNKELQQEVDIRIREDTIFNNMDL